MITFRTKSLPVCNLVYSLVRTGAGGLGNKGAVGMSMQVGKSVLTFAGVHLCAGEKEDNEKNRAGDIAKILEGLMTERRNPF
jgi:hypothetical protein